MEEAGGSGTRNDSEDSKGESKRFGGKRVSQPQKAM